MNVSKTVRKALASCLLLALMLVPLTVVAETAPSDPETVDAAAFQAALENKNTVVVDTRSNDQFNGWPAEAGDLAGHVQGAVDFSARWLDCEYDEENNLEGLSREEVLSEALAVKGIVPEKTVVLYDTNGQDAAKVAAYLQGKGFSRIQYFNALNAQDLPVVHYKNYQELLSPEVLKTFIDSAKAPTLEEGKKYFIFDVAWGEVDQSSYLDGHIPGAIHVNTDWFEPENLGWMLDSDENLLKLAARLGISKDDGAIVTGPEPMAATRFGTILKYLGVSDVRYLNGALVNWKAAGFELEKDEHKAEEIGSFGTDKPLRPELILTQDQVAELLKNNGGEKQAQLCDVRTREEYLGEIPGYSYHDKSGRIEGALYAWAGLNQNSSSMYYYRNIDKTMRNGGEILAMLTGSGIQLDRPIITFCGSGWRAAEVLWYLQTLGHEGDALYSDGWIGWSNNGRPALMNEDAKTELPEKPVLDYSYSFAYTASAKD